MSRFSKEGLIRLHKRDIHLLDVAALRSLSGLDWAQPCASAVKNPDFAAGASPPPTGGAFGSGWKPPRLSPS